MDPFGFGELAQKRMPQHMGGDIIFSSSGDGHWPGRHPEDDAICFTARELSAGARHKEGRGVVLLCLEPFIKHLARIPMNRHKIPHHPAFGLHVGKSLPGVLVPFQVQDLRDPQA